jgi:periplasmic divalent cation tolerance protein
MFAIVEVTTSGFEESKTIGKTIVEERLAACANIVPKVHSFFWWKDKLEESEESLLILKTRKSAVERLVERVIELHSYENPAIITTFIDKGSKTYLYWLYEEAKG